MPEVQQFALALTEVILPLGVSLSAETDCNRLVEVVLQEAQKICNADAGCIYLRKENYLEIIAQCNYTLNPDNSKVSFEYYHFPPLPLSHADGTPNLSTLATQVVELDKSLHIANLAQEQTTFCAAIQMMDAKHHYQTLSCLTIPLKDSQGKAIAVLQLFNAKNSNHEIVPFSEYHQQLAQWLSIQSAAALNNRLLLNQQADFLKSERDLQIGRQIQLDFLPETLPEAPGWEIAACFHPARDVAGDFYDAFSMPNGRIGIVIADVCDKGVGAALFMSLFRTLVRTLARQTYSLGLLDQLTTEESTPKKQSLEQKRRLRIPRTGTQALQNAITITNNYIAETHFRTNMFATMFFGVLDPNTGDIIYINGGHEAPLICGPDGIKCHLQPTGPAVGMMPNMEFQIDQAHLEPGDMLFSYTDGVPEAHAPNGKMFSDERLFALLENQTQSAQETLEKVEQAVRSHIADAAQFDDITMLAVRRTL